MPAIEVSSLTVRYGDVVAVDDLSFTAEAGRVTCIIGRNGAGKTSTIECLEGLRRPAAGRLAVAGYDPHADHRLLAPRIGVMLQEGGIQPGVRPLEILRHAAALYPRPLDPAAVAERLGLTPLADRTWRQLSGGEQRRLALGLALVGRPQVAFLDEPTAGVDPAGRQTVREVIADLRSDGVAVLLTTHDLDEAERVSDDIVILDRARLVASGSLGDLVGRAGGGRRIRFSTVPGLDVAALAAHVHAPVVETSPGRYEVGGPPNPAVVASVTAWLAAYDLPLDDLHVGRPRLEEVFLQLTSGAAASTIGGARLARRAALRSGEHPAIEEPGPGRRPGERPGRSHHEPAPARPCDEPGPVRSPAGAGGPSPRGEPGPASAPGAAGRPDGILERRRAARVAAEQPRAAPGPATEPPWPPGISGPGGPSPATVPARKRARGYRPDRGGPAPLAPLVAHSRLELALTLRNVESLLLTLGFPVIFLVFFSLVDVLPIEGDAVDFLVPGMLSLAVLATAFANLAIATGFDRSYGVLKRLGATPLGRGRLLAAKVVTVFAVLALQVALLVVTGLALGWEPDFEPVPLAGSAALAVVAFAGLALVVAGTLRALVALAVANALFVAALLLSGIVIPLSELPAALRTAVRLLPSTALAEAVHGSTSALAAVPGRVWPVLAGWVVAGVALAVKLFRWEPSG